MRSLFTLDRRISAVSNGGPDADAAFEQLAIDPESGTVYTAAASSIQNGSTTISIYAHSLRTSDVEDEACIKIAQVETLAASVARTELYPHAKLRGAGARKQVVSIHYLSDGGELSSFTPALSLVCAGGDIVFIPLPDAAQDLQTLDLEDNQSGIGLQPEIVGSIEQGIVSAVWSPDDELLTIVTEATADSDAAASTASINRSPKVLLMTKAFDVLSERALFTREFGEDEPVDVGWGSRATQFHGSAGKAAAAAAAAEAEAAKKADTVKDPRGPATLDDDGLARISWRGDGAFFMVSALEPSQAAAAQARAHTSAAAGLSHHRVIRIFGRDGNLSATSEPTVRGLTHVLSVRPTGNIIASSQRFGALDGTALGLEAASSEDTLALAKGREGRHDIVFFERNGLRHGEFSLREEREAQPSGHVMQGRVSKLSWSRDHSIREIGWNADGSALAVLLSRYTGEGGQCEDVLQIWTTGNYHWYLKQEIDASSLSSRASSARITSFRWHPEALHDVYIIWHSQSSSTSLIEHRTFFLDTVATSSISPPHDAACVSVTDGAALLLTSFRLQNVPPPMCSVAFHPTSEQHARLDRVPIHVAWADVLADSTLSRPARGSISILAVLFSGEEVGLFAFCWGQMPRAVPQGARKFPTPIILGYVSLTTGEPLDAIQVSVGARIQSSGLEIDLGVNGFSGARRVVKLQRVTADLDNASQPISGRSEARTLPLPLDARRARLVSLQSSSAEQMEEAFLVHTADGLLLSFEAEVDTWVPRSVEPPSFCPYLTILNRQPLQGVGLAQSGHLYAVRGDSSQLLARDATSFAVASTFLVWTNTAHQARFLPLQSLVNDRDGVLGPKTEQGTQVAEPSEVVTLGRSVERGSRIVAAVPSSMSLILQMPRGNLETICPRPMILEVVRAALDRNRFGTAFRICRTHRLDMNILHDHNSTSFMGNLTQFIDQVKEVDHLNLFLTSLRDDDVTEESYKSLAQNEERIPFEKESKVNSIAERIRTELQARDQRRYINTILTAFVTMKPPAYESALELLGQLRSEDTALADEAVRYIIFLADADKLFDIALGTYDFALVLMVAQHAKRKDPREYLPFLRELRALEPVEYQRFRIDDHLGRRAKALTWLLAAGPERHTEAMEYVAKHQLHSEAIQALAGQTSKLAEVHQLYAEYLEERHKPVEAALAYTVSGQRRKALGCYRQAGYWKDALALALEERLPASEIMALAREAADDYESKGKYVEAARFCVDYQRDIEQGVSLLCKANELSEARRLCSSAGRMDLIETTIKPGAFEIQERLLDELEEMRDQMDKQVKRLAELRSKKAENPDAFYVENDPALDNVDIMTDTSTQITQFTRYTSVPSLASMSTSSGMTGMTSSTHKSKKTKRKEERKKNSGKKGSIYEEDYLFDSLQKLLREKLKGLQLEVSRLLPHLAVLSNAHRNAGRTLAEAFECFEKTGKEVVEALWLAEQEQERMKVVELDKLVAAGPEVWMAAYHRLVAGVLGRRAGARAKMEMASESWRCEALRNL